MDDLSAELELFAFRQQTSIFYMLMQQPFKLKLLFDHEELTIALVQVQS